MKSENKLENIVGELQGSPDVDALKLVVDRVKLYEGYIKPTQEKRKQWWRIYRCELEAPQYDYQTNLAVPYSTSTIETVVPRMAEKTTYFRYKGETKKDDKNSRNMEELANDQMRLDKLELKKIKSYKECMVLGTAVYKVIWDKQEAKRTSRKPLIKLGKFQIGELRTTEKKTLKDQPTVEHLPLDSFMFDPYGSTVNGDNACDWVAHRKLVPRDSLDKNPNYKNLELIGKSDKANMEDPTESVTEVKKPIDEHKDLVEIIEYWEDDRLIVVANRTTVIRDEPNPYEDKRKPFIVQVDRPVPHQLLGMGEIEFLQGLQKLLNDMVNQAFDIQKVALNKLILVEKGSGLNKENLVSQPFGVHTVNDLQKIKVIDLPGVDGMTINLIELIKTFMEQISGVSDYSKGTDTQSLNDTATGIQLIQEAANYIFKLKLKLADKMFLEELGDFLVSRNQQLLEKSHTVRIKNDKGEEYKEITRANIEGNFVSEIDDSAPLNEQIRRQEALMLLREFREDPDVNLYELKKNVLDAFKQDSERILIPKPEIKKDVEIQITEAEQEAQQEDEIMAKGSPVEVAPDDDHEVHLAVHEEEQGMLQSPLLAQHMEQHKMMLSPRFNPEMNPENPEIAEVPQEQPQQPMM